MLFQNILEKKQLNIGQMYRDKLYISKTFLMFMVQDQEHTELMAQH